MTRWALNSSVLFTQVMSIGVAFALTTTTGWSQEGSENKSQDFRFSIVAPATDEPESETSTKMLSSHQGYVGTQKCVACHQEQYASYLQTSHSKTVAITDAKQEPPAASFHHEASDRDYEVIHRGDVLLHAESLVNDAGVTVARTELPITYSFGSGLHAKTYVCEDKDFLVESPITWYRGEHLGWGMSPGYDRLGHLSFQRLVKQACVYCHVGQIDRLEGNPSRFEIVEQTVSCERCHGPGESHIARYESSSPASKTDNIVNPKELTRELSEAICHQCHLAGVTTVESSVHSPWEFRPGEKITKYRTDYQYELDGDTMNIVGHVEQMHASKCYQETSTLTCITCHDPHHPPTPENSVDIYRQACLDCHALDACGIDHDERIAKNNDDCSKCHMPAAKTNVTHVAFHHHRIGIHTESVDHVPRTSDVLIPVVDDPDLPEQERKRRLAIAMYQQLDATHGTPDAPKPRDIATYELFQLYQTGVEDATITTALAEDAFESGYSEISKSLAEKSLQYQPRPAEERLDALRILGRIALARQDNVAALKYYRELVSQTRNANDHYYLGLSEQNNKNSDRAIASLKRSIELEPLMTSAHQALQAIYTSLGNLQLATLHADKAKQLDEYAAEVLASD
ncbi:multiheme c-type cytochrome [Rubripirellula amarantea]|nr:multiheme c-type cytochrome [Rubripirellula amarantea]